MVSYGELLKDGHVGIHFIGVASSSVVKCAFTKGQNTAIWLNVAQKILIDDNTFYHVTGAGKYNHHFSNSKLMNIIALW